MDAMNTMVAGFEAAADHHSYIDSNTIRSATQNIKDTLKDLYASYMMLIMIINRCIDHTKACHHIDLVPNLEITNLHELVAEVLHAVESINDHGQMTLTNRDLEVASHIITDRQWLQDNLLCICSNAVKYSSCKSVTLLFSLSIRRRLEPELSSSKLSCDFSNADENDQFLHFEVQNSGDSISVPIVDKLFHSPNIQKQRSMGGAGLGLFCLCLGQRVAALKGSYGVNNAHEAGTQGMLFWFDIPYKPVKTDLAREKSDSIAHKTKTKQTGNLNSIDVNSVTIFDTKNEKSMISPCSSDDMSLKAGVSDNSTVVLQDFVVVEPMKVLLVEDSKVLLKMVCMMLEKAGHTVHTATDGLQAVMLVRDQPGWDLVLTDLQMPVMDGIEAIRTTRQNEQRGTVELKEGIERHHLIIAMSANSDPLTVSEA